MDSPGTEGARVGPGGLKVAENKRRHSERTIVVGLEINNPQYLGARHENGQKGVVSNNRGRRKSGPVQSAASHCFMLVASADNRQVLL